VHILPNQHFDPLAFFRLKPLKAARVSEISEATASSPIPPEERVNFHIGNPVQDKRLMSAYLRMVLGIDVRRTDLDGTDAEDILRTLEWESRDGPLLAFLRQIIQQSAPYAPRGGFSRANPNSLVKSFAAWLQNQQEPLSYDLGQASGKREIVLSSGGIRETLRILFHALSAYLLHRPAFVLLWHVDSPLDQSLHPDLKFDRAPDREDALSGYIGRHFAASGGVPTFLIVGKETEEETRRTLRHLSLNHPLFFIEANDAPNHLSLAREAKLIHRVLRLLTPAIFAPQYRELATVFLAGNSDILGVFEAIHFQLKGTPSASEIELLSYLLGRTGNPSPPAKDEREITVDPPFEGIALAGLLDRALPFHSRSLENRFSEIIDKRAHAAGDRLRTISERTDCVVGKIEAQRFIPAADRFFEVETKSFIEELVQNIGDPSWRADLLKSFLNVFVKHHPEYRLSACTVVSGSSRTALGLLGFHCGIREVAVPDLSWSYEQCFPSIRAVPLTPAFELDADAMIEAIQKILDNDPQWALHGAVVINNPHNATGRVFQEESVRKLVRWLLEKGIYVIDDLSYEDVAPSIDLPTIKTVRQLADDLIRNGQITEDQGNKIIVVHSVSKTDCLAGARLAVAEIREKPLFDRFARCNGRIQPNLGAVALTYLFYRNGAEVVRSYWRLRNRIFLERTQALLDAIEKLPAERNPFGISILPPTGSMYPLLLIDHLPAGLSLEWLASGLARRGIGMLPLATFAHTEKGFETARKAFRLTLGGIDGAEALHKKTRRVLIDLNRLIAEESSRYSRRVLRGAPLHTHAVDEGRRGEDQWNGIQRAIVERSRYARVRAGNGLRSRSEVEALWPQYVAERLLLFKQRYNDRRSIAEELMQRARSDGGNSASQTLEHELYKDSLDHRLEAFHQRLSDRTVHPTQRYSIATDAWFNRIIDGLIRGRIVPERVVHSAVDALFMEFFGLNVPINSSEESDELILDLDTYIHAEEYAALSTGMESPIFLSFWGDWDGSNRPSGQAHRLVATTLIENVSRLSRLLSTLVQVERNVRADPLLLAEVEKVPENNRRFARLLNDITILTHQLEKRYRGILPFNVKAGRVRNLGMKLHLARDPLTLLWYHNDRLERKMLDLRRQRRETLEYYFALNKQLRKQLRTLIPAIRQHLDHRELLLEACLYRNLLSRMAITPRVHQRMITIQDQFAIDTTVHNIHEINEIGARYGNPGLILALQVSMSTKAEALIALDRKMLARREHTLRNQPDLDLPSVKLIPLFEELDSVKGIPAYCNKLWDYAHQSRRVDQDTKDRFAEIVAEIFIAGSDLSQQIGQAAGAMAFRQAKHEIVLWLAQRGLEDRVRIKMGSGEPMQRQGGYYAADSGRPAFVCSPENARRIEEQLPASARKSTEYAITPLMGIFAGGDLRTFQSTLSEHLRYLPVQELVQALHHIKESQRIHRTDLIRAAESLVESRLQIKDRGVQEMERLTLGAKDSVYERFLALATANFRQILYGQEADVVGLHVASYFIARTMPQLRDRPTVRPGGGTETDRGQRILEKIVQTIPLARTGSMLRAIAHNQAQTMVLGINQLTTGLFRALNIFSQMEFTEGDARTLVAERILPQLPVYEILQSLRLYHDQDLAFLKKVEPAFPAGNSAFLALREDNDSLADFLGLLQQELVRRHGVDVNEFFNDGRFNPELLPTLRPDLAVLLQHDLFNTSVDALLQGAHDPVGDDWKHEIVRLLHIRESVRQWRIKIWQLLEEPVSQQVRSFTELAIALNSLTSAKPLSAAAASQRGLKLSSDLSQFFRASNADDEMRQFLAASVEYLSVLSEGMVEVPVTIIRAIKDVEQIARIEEQALPAEQQDLLRFYVLQIARLTGENG
jgi:aspartate/methionine/tyrosine aminotransferase